MRSDDLCSANSYWKEHAKLVFKKDKLLDCLNDLKTFLENSDYQDDINNRLGMLTAVELIIKEI